MSFRFLWRIVAAGSLLPLAACNTANTHIGDEDPFLGEAVKYNAAIQTINPTPVYRADAAQPGGNGDVGAKAVERYRTDKVKAVQSLSTSKSAGGAAGAGGGSGPM